jgi:zinc transport system ATP-binding protein
VLDEPAAGIDANGIKTFYETLSVIKDKYDLAVILVSHDLEYVREYADTVVLIDKTVLCSGKPSEVFESEEFNGVFGVNV